MDSAVATTAFTDQKPGTSGLRKRVHVFQQPHYTQNFIQGILTNVQPSAAGATLVVGGDGRYYSKEVVQIILEMAAANGVHKLIVGKDGILSTPAASHLIRKHKATGGILLTASHNPGGPDGDFGIKYNTANGGPAPEGVTNAIYETTKTITQYYQRSLPPVDISTVGSRQVLDGFHVEVVDPVDDWLEWMTEIFDFDKMKALVADGTFKVLFDGMHGVTGPYARRVFVDKLGLPESCMLNCTPKPDFGGGHPDPNLTYAHELVERVKAESIDFGAASDGDGDRNMIISKDWFINPSDSVAVIAANARLIPYFVKTGVKGVARSMPTSAALDKVADKLGVPFFEVPTGWKFFGNLMDAGQLSICGEESFGTGSDHVREKDGLWAVLAWLNILAALHEQQPGISIKDVMTRHFGVYGRNYFTRYDYEEVDADKAAEMVTMLRGKCDDGSLKGTKMGDAFEIVDADDFAYSDPIDGSVSQRQGIRLIFQDSSRAILRLSGTGSHGATIRLYVERYVVSTGDMDADVQQVLKPLVQGVLDLCQLQAYTGRTAPTVIT